MIIYKVKEPKIIRVPDPRIVQEVSSLSKMKKKVLSLLPINLHQVRVTTLWFIQLSKEIIKI